MWSGRLRLAGGRKPGEEVDVRIARAANGAIVVDYASGTDAAGNVRWSVLHPTHLDVESLCAALVDSKEVA
jgi:hypothetical protein